MLFLFEHIIQNNLSDTSSFLFCEIKNIDNWYNYRYPSPFEYATSLLHLGYDNIQ